VRDGRAEEDAVLAVEKARVASLLRGDCGLRDSILADEFVEIGAGGRIRSKADNAADCRSGAVHFDRYDLSNLRARVYGDAALVFGDADLGGTYRGSPFARRTRYLRVYVRQNGDWRCVAAEGTPLTESAPQ
jgi:hypothetical protein